MPDGKLDPRAVIQQLLYEVWASEADTNSAEVQNATDILAKASAHIASAQAREQEAYYGS